MPRVIVSKEKYDQVREVERITGYKVAKLPEGAFLHVPDCVDGQYGVYRVKRVYRSGLKYFADMELVHPARSMAECHFILAQMRNQRKQEGWEIKEIDMEI